MREELLTYNKVLEEIGEESKKLLLGNGFSMAYDKDRFSFTSLLESAISKNIIQKDSAIYKVFSKCNTSDFEEIIRNLETALEILKVYKSNTQLEEHLRDDSEKLKSCLVDVITNNHPDKITSIPSVNLHKASDFIQAYDALYTLNYDLLLYWVTETLRERMEASRMINEKSVFVDGFGGTCSSEYVCFNNFSSRNTCFYLHGALHIFDNGDKIVKKTFSRTGKCLKEQIKEELNCNKYPVIVSEGRSDQKMAKIIHNNYLNHCYKSLSNISGNLVVLGTLLKSNDEHILEAILRNKVKKIYFGVSDLKKAKQDLASFIFKANDKKKEVRFYDYRSVSIWGDIAKKENNDKL